MSLSASMEDYLEAIYEIEKEKTAVRVRDVARKLGVTMPSVNGALKNLKALGLIRHHRYEYIELTDAGSARAAKIAAFHRILLDFLTRIIGVDADTAEVEACKMEHFLSAETIDKLTEYIARKSENPALTDEHENPQRPCSG